jgi:hypothetical protein
MKRYFGITIFILFFILTGLMTSLWNEEVCMAKEFDASLNVMGYDRDVTIKINGVHLSRIKGGQSHSVRLFLADDPKIKTLPPEMQQKMKETFCLKKGENAIEISFKEKGQPKAPTPITVSIDSGNYQVPVLTYVKNPDIKEGKAQGTFEIYTDEPAGFATVILQGEESGKGKWIPFDFSDLQQEDISNRYHKSGYKERKNPHFRFAMVFPKDWRIINVKEPTELPENSIPVEIGVFNRYKIPDDPQSDILAALYVTAVRVPSEWSDAKAVEKLTEYLLKGYSFKILKFQEYKLSNTTLKDILLTYEIPQDKIYWSRITGFKVKDETRTYLAGKKDILYLVHLHTSEKDYKAFAAEAFYIAKVTLQIIEDKK